MDTVASRIVPDDPALTEWTLNYWRGARRRLLGDVELVRAAAPSGSSVVELGAVPPFLTATLSELSYEVVGVDIAPDRFSRAISELGIDVRRADFETEPLPVPDESADLLLCNEVFEHMRVDLLATFERFRAALRHGGTLLLTTPNLLSAFGIANLMINRRAGVTTKPEVEYRKLAELGHMGHVREYTATEVRSFLEAVGFVVETVHWRNTAEGKPRILAQMVPPLAAHFTVQAVRR